MLTYSIRFKKVSVQPSNLGNFTIHQYRETQFINGNYTIFPTDKVSKTIIN